ncbi:MAG: leucine-rich repeat domain-containing protein [Chitinophagaceae bacterium]|nr:MAG: leucine-rich repeat domain-containing protein [Chitinophagaceae bacterium]
MPTIGQQWWESLSPQWKQAFLLCVLQKNTPPTLEDFDMIANMQVLRIAGPAAPHPNFPQALPDLGGVRELRNLEILIVSHHALKGIEEVSGLHSLKSLFVFNNEIESLRGIEDLRQLEQLYVNSNELTSITEITHLQNLRELNVADNRLTSLNGLTETHQEKLKKIFVKPNDQLKHKDILYVERELGIECR